jgi:hypothetical protein
VVWPEPFAKADQGEPHEGRQDLYDLELEEVSFVDMGDNPGAHILLYKRKADGQPDEQVAAFSRGQYADPEMVRALIDEVAGEGSSAGAETKRGLMTQFSKSDDVVARIAKIAEEKVANASGELTIAGARMEAWFENPELQERYQELRVAEAQQVADTMKRRSPGMMAAPTEEVAKRQAGPLAKHQAAVDELRKADPRMPLTEARRLAWEQNPGLYEEYRAAG